MKCHYWQFLLDEQGLPIEDAVIKVYVAETVQPIYLYESEKGGNAQLSTDALITTNKNGFFEFWVGDPNESYGYSRTIKFLITWEKGSDSGSFDNVDIFPLTITFKGETTSTWTSAAPTGYYYDFYHGLDNTYPLVQLYNRVTSLVQEPAKITSLSSNVLRIVNDVNTESFYIAAVG